MPTVIIGLVVRVLLLWGIKAFSKADPKQVAAGVKVGGGVVALLLAAFLGIRGELWVAIPLGGFGLSLLGWLPWKLPGFGQRTQRSPGQVSRVRSAFVEMELDHDTGAMRGRLLAGRHAGASLDGLETSAIVAMFGEIDDESRSLLMAYLDRRAPGWREDMQYDAAPGSGGPGRSGKMTEQEAYQILGVQPGASADEIGHAHRTLMKKLHPDQGGSTYLAARVNEAKDVLLHRHR